MAAPFVDEHYRVLFDSIDLGFCTIEVIFDASGKPVDYRFLDVNRAFQDHTGLRHAVGRRMRELAPGHEEQWFETYGQVAVTGTPIRFEHLAVALKRWYDVYAFRVGTPGQRRVAILFSDITARKQAEADLHASEGRYRALAESSANSIYRLSADGTELLEVYGGRVPQHVRTARASLSWLEDYVHPDDREQVGRAWFSAVASGTSFKMELRARADDGAWIWLLARAVPVRDEGGGIVEWIGSASDITERKKAEEALRRSEADHAAARREAEHANRTKDQFLAMLGHELRNPLAPMVTALQLMRLRGSASREQDVLERQVKHLTRMVDDLLDVARITRGQIELQREPIELSVVVARAMELAGPILEQRRNHLDLDVPQHGAGIDADPDRMAQVVANLVTNAAKYSEPGSRITVRGRRAGSVVCVSVKDEGIGIPSDMLASVFDAFVQQPQALERSGGGLGLGLAIVRNLVAAHGGRVRAESPGPSHGSEFIVELPATEVNAHAPEQRRSGSHEARTAPRARVLVVDDNEDAASMMRAALEQMGYVVDVASDGLSALDRAATFHPGVVLLDIGLPVIDGYEVARRLRSQEDGAPMRLIAVTGYGQETDTRRSRDAGFERHLVKPVDLDELERIIQSRPLVR